MNQEEHQEFYLLQTRKDVAELLGINDDQLRYLLYKKRPERCYTEYCIPKKRGGYRTINVPESKLRNLQRKLLVILEDVYKAKPAAYGFIKTKGHIANACNHCGKRLILNLDLKDFFDQIHFGRVRGMFKAEPYMIGDQASLVLAQIVCCKGKLPQGAPTSPIISNMICRSLDTQLTGLAKKHHLVYTRYADDITFSTYKAAFPKEVAFYENDTVIIGTELKGIIAHNSFKINEEKVFIRNRNKRQEVTGIIVNNKSINVSREYLRALRVMLYDCKISGVYDSALHYISHEKPSNTEIIKISNEYWGENDSKRIDKISDWYGQVLKGKIEYVRCVRGECSYYYKFALAYNDIFGTNKFDVSRNDLKYKLEEVTQKWCFVIELYDELETRFSQGSGFLLKDYGILTNYHVVEDLESLYFVKTSNGAPFQSINGKKDIIKYSETIDYALIDAHEHTNEGLEIADNPNISIGDQVILLSFPDHSSNEDTINYMHARITSRKKYLGAPTWIIDKTIFHGASGGVVLNLEYKVIGIIVAGINAYYEDGNEPVSGISGFRSIYTVIDDIKDV